MSFTAEKFTSWERLDGYLLRRCQELTGLDAGSVAVDKVEHTYAYTVAQSDTAVGAPVRLGKGSVDSVAAPVASQHDVLFKLKQARGICTSFNQ